MKTFHYERGHEAGKTMTVSELREKLNEYPQDMPVFGTWEGVCGFIGPDDFIIQKEHKGDEREECECLLINVERYF